MIDEAEKLPSLLPSVTRIWANRTCKITTRTGALLLCYCLGRCATFVYSSCEITHSEVLFRFVDYLDQRDEGLE